MINQSLSIIKTNWKPLLEDIVKKFSSLESSINQEIVNFKDLTEIYPPPDSIFKCFNYFNIEDTKVVILGQDPYHQPGQAQGLSFSVPSNSKLPPSLINIFKEIESEYQSKPLNGDLKFWAKQGVLLLNTTLTVRQSSPNSHLKIWKGFTQEVLKQLLEKNENVVFLVWGGNAKKCVSKLEIKYSLQSNHPSPLSANRGGWFGCNHFKDCNKILVDLGYPKINWVNE